MEPHANETPTVANSLLPWRLRRRKRRWQEKLAELFRRRYKVAIYGERLSGKTTLIRYLQTAEFPLAPGATTDAVTIEPKYPVEIVDPRNVSAPVRTMSIVDIGGDESFRTDFMVVAEKANLILYLLPAHKLGIPEDQPLGTETVNTGVDQLELSERYKGDLKAIGDAARNSKRKPSLCIIVTYVDKLGLIPRLWSRLTDRVRNSPQIANIMRRQGVFREVRVITGSLKDPNHAARIWAEIYKLPLPESEPDNRG